MKLRLLNTVAFLLALVGAVGPPALAQQITGSITSSQCVMIDVTNQSSVGIQVTGTWSGTLQPQISIQGQAPQNIQVTPYSSSTSQSTITANGNFVARVAGGSTFLLCGATVASGTANVFLNASQAVSLNGLGGGAAGSVAWSGVTAGSNTNALTMGSGGSLSPLNLGQQAETQGWFPPGIVSPAAAVNANSGSILSSHNIAYQVVYRTAIGTQLPSPLVTASNGACGTGCNFVITGPTLSSGYTTYSAYACDLTAGGPCTTPQLLASCTNLASGANCTLTTSPTANTSGVPTINTAWIQPPNVQAAAPSSNSVPGGVPFWFIPRTDGNYYPAAVIDQSACTPLATPCGNLMFETPVFLNDTGTNLAGQGNNFGVNNGIIKNNLFGVAHLVCAGTDCLNGFDDRAIGIRVETNSNMTGSSNPRVMGIYGETVLNGNPSALTGGGPDSGALGIRWTLADNRNTTSGALSGSPMVALDGFYTFGPSAGTSWAVGSCQPCAIGVRGVASLSTAGINGLGSVIAGVYGQVSGSSGGSGLLGTVFYADKPAINPASGVIALFAPAGYPTTSGNFFLRSDTANLNSILGGTLYLPSIQTDASTISIGGSIAPTGAVTTSQLATPTGFTATCNTAGAVTNTFKVVAFDSSGHSTASLTANANSCAADITATNFITLQNFVTPGASSYGIWFTTAGGTCNGGACTLGKIFTCTPAFSASAIAPTCTGQVYTGTVGDGTTVPAANTTGAIIGYNFGTLTNCAAVGTAASPSVASCSAASSGAFSCATNATGATCTVNTTAVTANSEIFVQEDETLGTRLGVTCNTSTNVLPASRLLNARVAGTSFTITLGTVTTNPACFTYFLVN